MAFGCSWALLAHGLNSCHQQPDLHIPTSHPLIAMEQIDFTDALTNLAQPDTLQDIMAARASISSTTCHAPTSPANTLGTGSITSQCAPTSPAAAPAITTSAAMDAGSVTSEAAVPGPGIEERARGEGGVPGAAVTAGSAASDRQASSGPGSGAFFTPAHSLGVGEAELEGDQGARGALDFGALVGALMQATISEDSQEGAGGGAGAGAAGPEGAEAEAGLGAGSDGGSSAQLQQLLEGGETAVHAEGAQGEAPSAPTAADTEPDTAAASGDAPRTGFLRHSLAAAPAGPLSLGPSSVPMTIPAASGKNSSSSSASRRSGTALPETADAEPEGGRSYGHQVRGAGLCASSLGSTRSEGNLAPSPLSSPREGVGLAEGL